MNARLLTAMQTDALLPDFRQPPPGERLVARPQGPLICLRRAEIHAKKMW